MNRETGVGSRELLKLPAAVLYFRQLKKVVPVLVRPPVWIYLLAEE